MYVCIFTCMCACIYMYIYIYIYMYTLVINSTQLQSNMLFITATQISAFLQLNIYPQLKKEKQNKTLLPGKLSFKKIH